MHFFHILQISCHKFTFPFCEAFVNETLSDIVYLIKGSKKVSRAIVDADNAMFDRHHFIIGWTSILQNCYDVLLKVKSWGGVRSMSADRLGKLEQDSCQLVKLPTMYICLSLVAINVN